MTSLDDRVTSALTTLVGRAREQHGRRDHRRQRGETLTETTVEEVHATAQAPHRHRLNVFVSVAAREQRPVEKFVLRPSFQSQLQLLFTAHSSQSTVKTAIFQFETRLCTFRKQPGLK